MASPNATKRLPAPERKRQILAAARELFGHPGAEEPSVDRLAEAAGISKPILYRHFPSKRELYLAVLEDHLADLIRRLWVALSGSADPRERLRGAFQASFEFVDAAPAGSRSRVEA